MPKTCSKKRGEKLTPYKAVTFKMTPEEAQRLERLRIRIHERLGIRLTTTDLVKWCIERQARHILALSMDQIDALNTFLTNQTGIKS